MSTYIESFGESRKEPKQLSEKPHINPTARIRNTTLGAYTDIGPGCTMNESEMGDYSYLAGHVSVVWSTIGKFCSIAAQTRINPGNHPTWRVTTNHSTYRRKQYGLDDVDDEEFFAWRKSNSCSIGHDVWIGHGVVVTAGTSIGTGACIGAGAVVTKDIPPYAIAVGVPAKVIKFRFDEKTIERIMETAYWDWDRETLEKNFADLRELDVFLEKHAQQLV
ncbi:MAG: acetyltransferase [Verrucomicrobiota bacterium]